MYSLSPQLHFSTFRIIHWFAAPVGYDLLEVQHYWNSQSILVWERLAILSANAGSRRNTHTNFLFRILHMLSHSTPSKHSKPPVTLHYKLRGKPSTWSTFHQPWHQVRQPNHPYVLPRFSFPSPQFFPATTSLGCRVHEMYFSTSTSQSKRKGEITQSNESYVGWGGLATGCCVNIHRSRAPIK